MAMRDQMDFEAVSAEQKHLKTEFAQNTDQLVSFGILPDSVTEPNDDIDPVPDVVGQPANTTPISDGS